jgi:hypothetical protein
MTLRRSNKEVDRIRSEVDRGADGHRTAVRLDQA